MLPGGIGFTEILVIAVVAVVLFGSRLPEVARNFGRSYTQFRKGLSDLQSSFKVDDHDRSTTRYSSSSSERLKHYKDAADEVDESEDDVPRFVAPPAVGSNDAADGAVNGQANDA